MLYKYLIPIGLAILCLSVAFFEALENPASVMAVQSGSVVYLHKLSNAFFEWTSPASVYISGLKGLPISETFSLLAFWIFTFFLSSVFGRKSDTHTVLAGVISLLFSSILLLGFGLDAFFWATILTVSCFLFFETVPLLTLSALFGCLLLGKFIVVALVASILATKMLVNSEGISFSATRIKVLFSLLSFCLLYSLAFEMRPYFPEYPYLARVVSDDGLPGTIRTLVGHSEKIAVIDRKYLKLAQLIPAFFAACLCIVAFFKTSRPSAILWAGFLSISIVFESILPERFSLITPLAALSRLSGETFLYPLSFIVLGLVSLTLLVQVRLSPRGKCLALVFAFIGTYFVRPEIVSRFGLQDLASSRLQVGSPLSDTYISPSYAILKRFGPDAVFGGVFQEELEKRQSQSLANNIDRISAYSNENVQAAVDGDTGTEWTSSKALQTGREWIEIKTIEPIAFTTLRLDTSLSPEDFPRGLRVLVGKDCQEVLFESNPWEGEILYSKKGLPYFGSQSKVVIQFSDAVVSSCLRLEQVASDVPFHWSITEVVYYQ